MSVLEVIKYGHPTLRQVAEPCKRGELTEKFISDMIDTMDAEDGVGLAAPQVDVAKQMLVARDPNRDILYVLINPQIIGFSEKTEKDLEGCLSFPWLQAEVERFHRIEVQAFDPDWNVIRLKTKGLFARVLQHEIDHLNGILYIDRAEPDTLVHLKKKAGSEEYAKIPTTIEQVRSQYRKTYHANADRIIFDAPA